VWKWREQKEYGERYLGREREFGGWEEGYWGVVEGEWTVEEVVEILGRLRISLGGLGFVSLYFWDKGYRRLEHSI